MPGPVVVLGVAPGIRHLAYVVLAVGGGPKHRTLDHDVLKGARATPETPSAEVRKKAGIALKILEVVIERAPPAILVIGPPASSKEPALHVDACRILLRLLAHALTEHGLKVRVFEQATQADLLETLGTSSLKRIVAQKIDGFGAVRAKPLQLAAASALAGVVSHETSPCLLSPLPTSSR